ncbi:MAG: hypothetical protein WC741_01540 [Patescibacteria group bacterium]|jgi:hypothetical protein
MIDYIKKNLKLLFIVLAGFVFLMITIFPSGSHYCYQDQCGVFIWGANGHDGIWHLSLISTAFKQFPFIIPVYKNGLLVGYNYLMDFSLYLLTFLGFSPQFLFFKLIPIVWFMGFCYFLILLGRKIVNNSNFIFWLLFFSFFGSSFTFLLPLYHNGSIWGGSSLVSMQSGQALTNIQFALSLVILLIIFYILKTKKLNYRWICIIGSLLLINLGLKFYGGFVSAATIYIFLFIEHINSRDRFKLNQIIKTFTEYIILSVFVVLAIVIFYDPFHSFKTGSTFTFSPLAVIHPMIEEPALFYWLKMANARYFLYTKGFSLRLLLIELFSTGIFLFFSLGLRIFAFIEIGILFFKKKISKFDLTILLAALSAFLFCILFVQKGDWWNVIQFYYYTLFILNFYTALFVYRILKKTKSNLTKIFIIGGIILLTLPCNLDILKTFSHFPAQVYIPDPELQALAFLKKQPEGVVLTQRQNKSLTKAGMMNPIAYAEDSAYVSAFTFKQTYMNDYAVLYITGIDYKKRLERIKALDCSVIDEVTYVYQLKSVPDDFFSNCVFPEQKKLKKIFENNEVIIYKR